jgi:hypothetical protein
MQKQRKKQVKTGSVLDAFLANEGNLEKSGAAVGLDADKVRTKVRSVLNEQKFCLENAGKPIPAGEAGYEEGKENKYRELTREERESVSEIVAALSAFPVLTQDERKKKKGNSAADLLAIIRKHLK